MLREATRRVETAEPCTICGAAHGELHGNDCTRPQRTIAIAVTMMVVTTVPAQLKPEDVPRYFMPRGGVCANTLVDKIVRWRDAVRDFTRSAPPTPDPREPPGGIPHDVCVCDSLLSVFYSHEALPMADALLAGADARDGQTAFDAAIEHIAEVRSASRRASLGDSFAAALTPKTAAAYLEQLKADHGLRERIGDELHDELIAEAEARAKAEIQ